jgi:hypothetical protein
MANPTSFQITPFVSAIENTELNFHNLYLEQIYSGSNTNQSKLIPGDATYFGETAVNNWAIFEGIGQDAKLVAHAKGMHMQAVDWYNSFNMVFDGERYVISIILYSCRKDYVCLTYVTFAHILHSQRFLAYFLLVYVLLKHVFAI